MTSATVDYENMLSSSFTSSNPIKSATPSLARWERKKLASAANASNRTPSKTPSKNDDRFIPNRASMELSGARLNFSSNTATPCKDCNTPPTPPNDNTAPTDTVESTAYDLQHSQEYGDALKHALNVDGSGAR